MNVNQFMPCCFDAICQKVWLPPSLLRTRRFRPPKRIGKPSFSHICDICELASQNLSSIDAKLLQLNNQQSASCAADCYGHCCSLYYLQASLALHSRNILGFKEEAFRPLQQLLLFWQLHFHHNLVTLLLLVKLWLLF